jgi:predicted glycosyltransferase
VLASGGGGRDAYLLLDCALSAFDLIPRRRRPELTLVAGPLMDAELRTALAERAEAVGAIFHATVHDMPDRLGRSDLFLTMGGYNSVIEALATGCASVVVPRVGPSAEQRIRAERLRDAGLARVIWRHDLTPARLAQAMTARIGAPPATLPLDFDGAVRAAEAIAAMLAAIPPAIATPPEVSIHA